MSATLQTPAVRTRRPMRRRARQAWLIVHVVSSVGWLGVELAALALCLAGISTDDPDTAHAMFTSASVLVDALLLPASVVVVLSGVVLGLRTKWGLVKYYWVFAKLIVGVVLFVASAFTLEEALQAAAEMAAGSELLPADGISLAGMLSVIGFLSLAASVVSTVKPWGRINWRRSSASARAEARS